MSEDIVPVTLTQYNNNERDIDLNLAVNTSTDIVYNTEDYNICVRRMEVPINTKFMPPKDEKEEPASEPVVEPAPETAPEPAPEPAPKPKEEMNVLNSQKFRAIVESIRDEAIKSIEKVRNIKTTKFKFKNELKDIYDKTIKEIAFSIRKTAAAEVNENFDSEKLKEKLEPFKLQAKEASKVFKDDLDKEAEKLDEIDNKIFAENSTPPSDWSEASLLENYPKWKEKVDKYEDDLESIFLKTIENHSLGGFENTEKEFKESIDKYLKEMNESAEKLDKLNTKISHWEDLLDEINALLERDPESKIGTSKTTVEQAVKALDIPIKNLDFKKAEAEFNKKKYDKEAFNKHKNSLEKQMKLSDERLAENKKPSKKKVAKEAADKAVEAAKEASREQVRAAKAADAAKKKQKEIEAEKDDLDDEEDEEIVIKPVRRVTRSTNR